MKSTDLPVEYSFTKLGTIQCKVTSGSVTVQLDGADSTYGPQQGNGSRFQKTRKKDSDPTCRVKVFTSDTKAKMVFTGP